MAIAGVSPHLNEWKQAQLSELGTLYCGQSPASADVNTEGRGTPYATGPEQWDGKILHRTKWTTDPRRIVPDGCIFITVKGAGVGKIFPGIPCAIGRDIYAFKPNDGVSPKFIEHALRLTVDRVLRHAVGDIPGLSKAHILDHEISLPGLVEQELIVEEIEKQFSRLDEAVANLKRVKANLKRYRAALLKAAVEGRLVPTEAELARREGRSYETGEQLLARILRERRAEWEKPATSGRKKNYVEPQPVDTSNLPNLPEGWTWASVEQVGRLQLGRQRAPKYHAGKNMRPYLRVQNVFEARINLSDVKEMDFPGDDFETYKLQPGDLLLNEGQSPELLGRPAIYRGEIPGACFTNTLIRFQAVGLLAVDFALVVFRQYMRAGRFTAEATITTNIAHLSLGRLKTIEFPVPPLPEQQRIAEEVERHLSIADGMEAQLDCNVRRSEHLRGSTLRRAFSGGLAV